MDDMSEATDDGADVFSGKSGELPLAEGGQRLTPVGRIASACPACGAADGIVQPRPLRGGVSIRATLPRAIAGALLLIPALTPRERATFELLGLGYDNRSIARALEISERTAKRYVTAILSKLGLESRLQAGLTALIVSSCVPTGVAWPEGRIDVPVNS
jgi:DNA-binding CsgD family transcriptional regulator